MPQRGFRGVIISIALGLLVPAGVIGSTVLFLQLVSIDDHAALGMMYMGGFCTWLAVFCGAVVGAVVGPRVAEVVAARGGNRVHPTLIAAFLNAIGGLTVGAAIWSVAAVLLVWLPSRVQ
jgi:hypothetical protein